MTHNLSIACKSISNSSVHEEAWGMGLRVCFSFIMSFSKYILSIYYVSTISQLPCTHWDCSK